MASVAVFEVAQGKEQRQSIFQPAGHRDVIVPMTPPRRMRRPGAVVAFPLPSSLAVRLPTHHPAEGGSHRCSL